MTISTNKTGETNSSKSGGAIADALTFVRLILTPVIMFIIIKGWPDLNMALLASFLMIIAAFTDFLDDYFGGTENAPNRKFGWFDDIADIILVVGTLIALLYVTYKGGVLGWMFAVPAGVIIGREVLVGLLKGYDMTKSGWPETKYGSIKNGLVTLGTCLLVASPWITNWIDRAMTNGDNVEALVTASPQVWMIGQGVLWFAALVSIITGLKILTTKAGA
ncbi:MAG: CDP-alcohol phosphatidyltransferase family protein [Hellea sp.]